MLLKLEKKPVTKRYSYIFLDLKPDYRCHFCYVYPLFDLVSGVDFNTKLTAVVYFTDTITAVAHKAAGSL